jgi:transposase
MGFTSLVFIDESCAKTNMTRLYGRACQGERCLGHAPHGHWNATTMIGALRLNGENPTLILNDAMDTLGFNEYIFQVLIPALQRGDKVIWDNLPTHHSALARAAIEAVGAEILPLPPYSPDLNPIEKMWSKVKSLLRSTQARTQDELYEAIAFALKSVTAEDAKGWFQACGYVAVQS